MDTMEERLYTEEQAQEILRMASQASLGGSGITSRQLQETAAELGISPEQVLYAEQVFLRKQQLDQDRIEFSQYKRKHLLKDVSSFLSGAVFLYGIEFVSSHPHFDRDLIEGWPKWAVGFWAIFLAKEVIEYATEMTVNRQAAFEKWRRKKSKKVTEAASTRDEIQTPEAEIILNASIRIEEGAIEKNQAHS